MTIFIWHLLYGLSLVITIDEKQHFLKAFPNKQQITYLKTQSPIGKMKPQQNKEL
jgi:hypothetical protein